MTPLDLDAVARIARQVCQTSDVVRRVLADKPVTALTLEQRERILRLAREAEGREHPSRRVRVANPEELRP